jgi:hypothetical protein
MSTAHALRVPVSVNIRFSCLHSVSRVPPIVLAFSFEFFFNPRQQSSLPTLCPVATSCSSASLAALSARSLTPMPTWAGIHIIFRFALSSASRSFSSAILRFPLVYIFSWTIRLLSESVKIIFLAIPHLLVAFIHSFWQSNLDFSGFTDYCAPYSVPHQRSIGYSVTEMHSSWLFV